MSSGFPWVSMCDRKKIFGQILQSVRLQKGLTQAQLAEKLSVINTAVSNWEKGIRGPDLNDLYELAEALNVSVDFLLGRSDSPKVHKPRPKPEPQNNP